METNSQQYPAGQSEKRARLYTAHQNTLECYWDNDGHFIWQDGKFNGGYRAILWHCLSYLASDARCVERANRIVTANFMQQPCHFAPGAAIDILTRFRDRLSADAAGCLTRYVEWHVPYLFTDDLKIHGYNDNHVYKAIHALVVGGELLQMPHFVERGVVKLRQAMEVFERTGFPCEYASPNYSPVSLNPLANIVEHARSEEARALALRLERFYWQDIALHFDPRVGLPTGPFSRGYVNDYDGLLSGTLTLLAYLFPERFAFDLVQEAYPQAEHSELIDPALKANLPFWQAHPVWYASVPYHMTPALEDALFRRETGAVVRGTTETGTWAVHWKDTNTRPAGAPDSHRSGPRNSLITTYYGDGFSLGTSQYSWLDNGQAHGFYATLVKGQHKGQQVRPQDAAAYYARLFFDEDYPFGDNARPETCFRDCGEIRTVQHEGSALVFYNPQPLRKTFQRLRTGVFRPLAFSQPRALWVGETPVPTFNLIADILQPVAIDEGDVYVGIVPLRLTDRGQSRRAALQIQTFGGHLSVLMSSFEGWQPQEFSYAQILETNAGFAWEIQPARAFASFAAFRRWLADAQVSDDFYSEMRTTTYRRAGLSLSACYSPYQTAFRYVSVNGTALPAAPLFLSGISDPGCALLKAAPEK